MVSSIPLTSTVDVWVVKENGDTESFSVPAQRACWKDSVTIGRFRFIRTVLLEGDEGRGRDIEIDPPPTLRSKKLRTQKTKRRMPVRRRNLFRGF